MKWLFGILFALPLVVTIIIVTFAGEPAIITGDKPNTLPDRIERECQREYGERGDEAVVRCGLALSVHALREREAEKINRAYDRAR